MNLAPHIEQRIPVDVRDILLALRHEAREAGQRIYLVGGSVRDLLLDRHNYDLDVAVEGDALALVERLTARRRLGRVAHPGFRTAKLLCGRFTVDVATARRETYARPGALPDVQPSDIRQDLSRRDFTVNAMAVSLSCIDYGDLIDFYGGKADLDRRYIRVLYERSFVDDATRMFRAARYEQRLGFELEPTTERLLRRDISMLNTVSADRIRHELQLVLREAYPERVLRRLHGLGVLQEVHPGLTGDDWVSLKFEQARQYRPSTSLPLLYLSLLLYRLSSGSAEALLARLNLPGSEAAVLRDVLRLRSTVASLDVPDIRRSEIYFTLEGYRLEALEATAIASDSPRVRARLDLFLRELRHVKTFLNGSDLQALGFPQGPGLGQALTALRRARLDEEVKTRDDEERLALALKESAGTAGLEG